MIINDLFDKTLREIVDEYCVVFSPECDYTYGISTWDEAERMFEEYDLEDEYCYDADPLVPCLNEFYTTDKILEAEDLDRILDNLGIEKKKKNIVEK